MNILYKLKRLFVIIKCNHRYKYDYLRMNDTYIITKTCTKCGKVIKSKGKEL